MKTYSVAHLFSALIALASYAHGTRSTCFVTTPSSNRITTRARCTFNHQSKVLSLRPRTPLVRLQAMQLQDFASVWKDLAVAGALGFGTTPLAEVIYNVTVSSTISTSTATSDSTATTNGDASTIIINVVEFQRTFWFGLTESISQAARIYGLVILSYLLIDTRILNQIIPVSSSQRIREVAPQIGFAVWIAFTVGTVKRSVLANAASKHPGKLGRISLYDRLGDFVILIITSMFVLDLLSLDAIGNGMQSLFAAGGIGALIFSLASKDLAEQIVGGLVIAAWDVFEVGDDIVLGDGTEGTVIRIGLVETEIRGYDNVVIKVPNSQLFNQRVSNISRQNRSQVKQTLRLRYRDLKKVPALLELIKQEIRQSCPKLIVDGSRPFRAHLTEYKEDHIQIVVNCHFEIQPGCCEYYDMRQQVLLAIARAIERSGVQFALPSIHYKTEGEEFILLNELD